MMVLWFVFAAVIAYLVLAAIVGRMLLYNDIRRRATPSAAAIAHLAPEDVEFRSGEHLVLRGWFVKAPTNPNGRTVIVVHGWQRDRSRVTAHIDLLVRAGFHVLAYDQRGHGASDTAIISYGVGEAGDLAAAVEYLRSRPEVDSTRIAALGFSLGSGGIVYAVATGPAHMFRAVVIEGIFSDSFDVGRHMLTRRFGSLVGHAIGFALFTVGAKLWTFGRFRHSRPVDIAERTQSTPMMIIRGKNDHMVPPESATAFITAVPDPKEVWVTDEGRHSDAFVVYPDEYKSRVLGFLAEHLDRDEPTGSTFVSVSYAFTARTS